MVQGHDALIQQRQACCVYLFRAVAKGIREGLKMMRAVSVLVSCVLLFVTAGCVRAQKYIDVTCGKMPGDTLLDREAAIQCQTFKKDEAATAVYTEASLLVKSYRACLGKYEGMPADRAKEYCAEYPKAHCKCNLFKGGWGNCVGSRGGYSMSAVQAG